MMVEYGAGGGGGLIWMLIFGALILLQVMAFTDKTDGGTA